MRRLPNSELPVVSIMVFGGYDRDRLLRRQFPRTARKVLRCEAVSWQGELWAAIYDNVWEWKQKAIASAKLLPKPRRYNNHMVEFATLDPELIAFVLLRV